MANVASMKPVRRRLKGKTRLVRRRLNRKTKPMAPQRVTEQADSLLKRRNVMTIISLFMLFPQPVSISIADFAGLNMWICSVARLDYLRFHWDGFTPRDLPARAHTDPYPIQNLQISATDEGIGDFIVDAMRRVRPNSYVYGILTLALMEIYSLATFLTSSSS